MWKGVIRKFAWGVLLTVLGGFGIMDRHYPASHRFPPTPELNGTPAIFLGVVLAGYGVVLIVHGILQSIDVVQSKPEIWD